MIKSNPRKKPQKRSSKKASVPPLKTTNASVRAFFGHTGPVQEPTPQILFTEDNEDDIGVFRNQPGVEGTMEMMIVVPDPKNPEKVLMEVITPEVVTPVIELMMTDSIMPDIPSVMLTEANNLDLFPTNFLEIECHVDNGIVLVMVDPEIEVVLKEKGIDIERDITTVLNVGSITITEDYND